MRIRRYGESGPCVVLVHGGPGAGGYLAPLARALADSFRVVEPLQRRSGGAPLTVATHVADLREVVDAAGGEERPALVGHSWGAMLALAMAAAHPDRASALVLIGCGTFDPASRERVQAAVAQRMDEGLRRRIQGLAEEVPDPDERLRRFGELLLPLYSHDAGGSLDVEECDARGHDEAWRDMVRLQEEGVYPSSFGRIGAPVIMLHGAMDPHPGRLIAATLRPWLPQLEYREWERCGHYPWLEGGVREEFLAVLRGWLRGRTGGGVTCG